jgi:hypothetical protein
VGFGDRWRRRPAEVNSEEPSRMRNWLIPMVYAGAALTGGFLVPRLEHAYFASYLHDIAVGSALAYLSAVASGMMTFAAIVFTIAYITVQFSAIELERPVSAGNAREHVDAVLPERVQQIEFQRCHTGRLKD